MKTINAITLDELNSRLIERLAELIDRAETGAEVVELTAAVAKLNASIRNNDQFSKPQTADERSEAERSAVFGELIGGA